MSKEDGEILIVDDEQEIRKYLSLLMRKEGFKALVAQDGRTTLKMIGSETSDVILPGPWKGPSFKEIVRNNIAVERGALIRGLQYPREKKPKAARLIKIDCKTIHTKTNQLGISIDGGMYG
jgi:DNA-binding NtrC family response regulator